MKELKLSKSAFQRPYADRYSHYTLVNKDICNMVIFNHLQMCITVIDLLSSEERSEMKVKLSHLGNSGSLTMHAVHADDYMH